MTDRTKTYQTHLDPYHTQAYCARTPPELYQRPLQNLPDPSEPYQTLPDVCYLLFIFKDDYSGGARVIDKAVSVPAS